MIKLFCISNDEKIKKIEVFMFFFDFIVSRIWGFWMLIYVV